ncbi:MAG: nucleotide exchange factor GrpE [Actinobacteria bacterium 13_2_20CM_2_71_6]|nr:MAG: nucleotide exchange factor GrpE [Actinobacteria bacterium 13_2_20CM_2_71_6]
MSSRPSLFPAAGVFAFLAVLTGVATFLASGRPLIGLIGLVGAAVSGAAVLILLPTPQPATPAASPVEPAAGAKPAARKARSAPAASTAPVAATASVAATAPVAPAGSVAPASDPDRTSLVQICIYLRDRVTSTALATRLDQALAQVGVSTVEPTGERFDPSHHEAGGALPTTDDTLVGTIAAVEAPGYADRGVLLRPPVVTVYQRRQG